MVPIPLRAKVVARLPERCVGRIACPFPDLPRVRSDVECAPVREDTARRVGIVENQGEAAGSCRRIGPLHQGRQVLSIAGEARRYVFAGNQRRHHELHLHSPFVRGPIAPCGEKCASQEPDLHSHRLPAANGTIRHHDASRRTQRNGTDRHDHLLAFRAAMLIGCDLDALSAIKP